MKSLSQRPVIISASRSTDVPAFYAEWFFRRLKEGWCGWRNPFNGAMYRVGFEKTRFVVFWSKNPKPLLAHVDELRERGIGCYVQFTLNDYVAEGLEKGVPGVEERIETFKALVTKLGKGRVIWRFDPLVMTDQIDADALLAKVERIGDALKGWTEKLVFSFVDIAAYAKVQRNLRDNGVNAIEWTPDAMRDFARRLVALNQTRGWGYTLATCGETADLEGVEHNKCIDDALIARFAWRDKELMDFLGLEVHERTVDLLGERTPVSPVAIEFDDDHYTIRKKNNKDNGQRKACGCVASKDIGEYNTCPHLCEYCYANANKATAQANYHRARAAGMSGATITGAYFSRRGRRLGEDKIQI